MEDGIQHVVSLNVSNFVSLEVHHIQGDMIHFQYSISDIS